MMQLHALKDVGKAFICSFAALALFPPANLFAASAAAVQDDGYAGKVLQKILDTGKLAFSQRVNVRLSLDEEGKVADCRAGKGGTAICQAARAAAPFGSPPYGLPTTIALSFWNGQLAPVKSEDHGFREKNAAAGDQKNAPYLAKITHELRDAIYIPQQTKKGKYTASVRLEVQKDGKIGKYSISKSSGDAWLDKYISQGITRAGKVTPPPEALKNPVDLTFSFTRN